MKGMRFFLFVVLVCSSAMQAKPLSEWLQEAQGRMVTEVLPNGLTVVCYPIPNKKNVRVGVTYNVGSKDELPEEYGFAHMVEHMIFKGTEKMSESDLRAISDTFGVGRGGFNASTSGDLTTYYFNTDAHNWPVFLDILADCMFNVRFDENHFASEVKVVIEEINQRETMMSNFVGEELYKMVFPAAHPYHHPICGSKEILLKATADDLKAFYKRLYHPSKALLTIVGDIDVEKALACARKAFHENPSISRPIEVETKCEESTQKKERTVYKPIAQAHYSYCWKLSDPKENMPVLNCLSNILQQRLHRALVSEAALAHMCNVQRELNQFGGGLMISFNPKNEQAATECTQIIHEVLNHVMKEGPFEKELERFARLAEPSFVKAFESCETLSGIIERYFFPDHRADAIFSLIEDCQQVTADDIKNFAQLYLQPADAYTLVCLPIPEADKAAWLKKKKEEDAYEQAILQEKIRSSEIEAERYVQEMPKPQFAEFTFEAPDKMLTLNNGLTVYVKKRDTSPFIYGELCFKDEEFFVIDQFAVDKGEIAELSFNLIVNTIHESGEELQKYFEARGAATFCADFPRINFSSMRDHFSDISRKVISMLSHPVYGEHDISLNLESIRNTLTVNQMDPGYVASRMLETELLKGYPWKKTDKERVAQLNALSRNDLVQFHNQYINPSNMILLLVGNIDLDTVNQMLEETFGNWEDHAECTPLFKEKPPVPLIENPRARDIIHSIPVKQVCLSFGRLTECFETKDALGLRLLESYVSKKVFEIRERSGLFYTPYIRFSILYFRKGIAQIKVMLSPGNVEPVEKAIKGVLQSIAEEGIPEKDLIAAKKMIQMRHVKRFTTNEEFADAYCTIFSNDKPVELDEQYLAGLHALTKEEVDAIARIYLDPKDWTTVKVGRIEKGLWSWFKGLFSS